MNVFDNKIIVNIFGLLIVWEGIDTILYPKWESSKFLMTIDVTPIKWTFGFLLIFVGLLIIYQNFKNSDN